VKQKHLGSTQIECQRPNVTTLNIVPWLRHSGTKWRRLRWLTSRWEEQEEDQITQWKLSVGWLVQLSSLGFVEMLVLGRVAQTASTPGLGSRRALATPVPDPEFIERTVEEPRVVSQPVPPEPPPSSPPPSLVHLASCAQEPLHTPEKSEAPASPPLLTPRTRLSSTKTEAQQLFLTPKEKYAKGVSALSDTAKQTVPCELNQDLVLDIPKENESPDKEALTEDSLQPVKRVKLTMADLMRAKKRMAEQKKLILEHGEVRPAQKPRIKTRPVKKKVTRKLQANDVFHRTEGPGVATEQKDQASPPMSKRVKLRWKQPTRLSCLQPR